MGSKKGFFHGLLLMVIAAFIFCPNTAWVAMPGYMILKGENQGPIEGSCAMGGREGTILVYAFGHNISIPTDPQSGLPSGKRIHKPLEILKEFDKSSPQLYQALCTGERITNVDIKFYRINKIGSEEHYFTIRLEDAIITKIVSSMPPVFLEENEPFRQMETVSFLYKKIRWTWEPDGIESEDSWVTPR